MVTPVPLIELRIAEEADGNVKVMESVAADVPPFAVPSQNETQLRTALFVVAVTVSEAVPTAAVVTVPFRMVRLAAAVLGTAPFVVTGRTASRPATNADKKSFVQGSLVIA